MVKVLLFADLKKIAGTDSITLPLDAPITSEQLWSKLVSLYSEFEKWKSCTRIAQNGTYAPSEILIQSNDEIALIPPVSGG